MEKDTESQPQGIVRAALIFYAGMLVLALVIAAASRHSLLFASPEAALAGVDWALHPLYGALTAAGVVAASAGITAATRWGDALARSLGEVLGPLSWRHCLVLAAASGVAEELLFRGALQPLLGYVAASPKSRLAAT